MPDLMRELRGLRPEERQRLEAFAELFDRIDASSYATYAEASETPEVKAAKENASELLGSGERRNAVRGAVNAFVDAATIAYSRRLPLPDTIMVFNSLPDRAEERVHFLNSVERAVVAVTLWDELADEDRVALLGPWGFSVIPLIEGQP
jgi:hypothetical protein